MILLSQHKMCAIMSHHYVLCYHLFNKITLSVLIQDSSRGCGTHIEARRMTSRSLEFSKIVPLCPAATDKFSSDYLYSYSKSWLLDFYEWHNEYLGILRVALPLFINVNIYFIPLFPCLHVFLIMKFGLLHLGYNFQQYVELHVMH